MRRHSLSIATSDLVRKQLMPAVSRLERYWYVVPLAVFALSRVVGGILLTIGASRQAALAGEDPAYKLTEPTPASPGYLGVVANWDGQWFWSIARDGYPSELPRVAGDVVANEWAFTAGYPFLVRAVMRVAGIDFPLAATIVSTACGALAMVLLYDMVRARVHARAATTVVLALSFFPSAPVFQVAYSESLALLLVVLALRALTGRRHGLLVVWSLVLSVTRPILLPVAALAGALWVLRWVRREEEPFPIRERVVSAAAVLACTMLVGVWPCVAAVVTRDPRAFTDTMAVWPGNEAMGGASANWLTLTVTYPVLLVVPLLPLLVAVGWASLRPSARELPVAWRWWGPVYIAYILVATKPSAGILRYVLLAVFPLAPFIKGGSRPAERGVSTKAEWLLTAGAVCVGVVGQYYWVTTIFTIDEAPTGQLFP